MHLLISIVHGSVDREFYGFFEIVNREQIILNGKYGCRGLMVIEYVFVNNTALFFSHVVRL